ncbi:carbohydrate ABC transporter permease [Paracoccus methylarcula]|uniref:Sugar ABC transporter permease n=1 Tax=Paracoccus methylarcula TaxID=72022 RepID=A0A422QVA6_9RHOB|nr:sugar ABC transporter permease [Paracoccus methylarcula]RNF33890.1 sugar ABC transporter permease [Paracoccus methylarcula]
MRLTKSLPNFMMLTPFMLLFGAFFLYPILSGFGYSFFDWDGIHEPAFVGLKNYEMILNARSSRIAATNLLTYVMITVPLGVSVAFGLALLVDHFQGFWARFFRSVYFVPVVMPLFLAATIWRWIYAPNFGVLNLILGWFGFENVRFLTDPDVMLYSLIGVDVWVSAGFNMVILLAGLKDIPRHYYEAARLDGANKLQEIRYVTLPMIRPVMIFVVTYSFISALQVFDIPWLLTGSSFLDYGGRRDALLFPVMDMMGRGFGRLGFGQAAAYGFLLTLVIVAITATIFAFQRKKENG